MEFLNLVVSGTVGVISAPTDLSTINLYTAIVVQLPATALATDAVDVYASNIAAIASTAQAQKMGSVVGRAPVCMGGLCGKYLYAIRTAIGTPGALTATVSAQSSQGVADSYSTALAAAWVARADVYISSTGNDGNDGLTSGTAIRTVREWALRRGALAPSSPQTVHFTDYGPYDLAGYSLATPNAFMGGVGYITFQGTRTYTPGVSGVITAAQYWNGPLHEEGLYTIPGIDFSIYTRAAGYFLEVVGGPRDGMSVTIGSLVGPSQIQSSGGEQVYVAAEPQVGDAVRVYRPTRIVSSSGWGLVGIGGDGSFFDLDFGTDDVPTDHQVCIETSLSAFANCDFHGCVFRSVDTNLGAQAHFLGCVVLELRSYGRVETVASIVDGTCQVRGTGHLELNSQTLILDQGPYAGRYEGSSTISVIGATCVSGYTTPLTLDYESALRIDSDLWFKDANAATAAVQIKSGGSVVYSVLPSVVGIAPGQQSIVGTTNKLFSAWPYVDAGSQASVVTLV